MITIHRSALKFNPFVKYASFAKGLVWKILLFTAFIKVLVGFEMSTPIILRYKGRNR